MSNVINTPPFRATFPYLFQPREKEGKKPSYEVVALFPKGADLTPLKNAIQKAATEYFGATLPPKMHNPLQPCNPDENGGYHPGEGPGMYKCRISGQFPPDIIDRNRQKILDKGQIYAGVWLIASLAVKGYGPIEGKRGVTLYLEHILKVKDDERLLGLSAEQRFAEIVLPEEETTEEINNMFT